MKKVNINLEMENDKIVETIENLNDFGFHKIENLGEEKEIGKKGVLKKLINDDNFWNNTIENEALRQIPKNTKNEDLEKQGLPDTSTEAILDVNARLLKVDNWEKRIQEVEKKVPIIKKFSTDLKTHYVNGDKIENPEILEMLKLARAENTVILKLQKLKRNTYFSAILYNDYNGDKNAIAGNYINFLPQNNRIDFEDVGFFTIDKENILYKSLNYPLSVTPYIENTSGTSLIGKVPLLLSSGYLNFVGYTVIKNGGASNV